MLLELDLPSAGRGTEAEGPIPTEGQLSESEEKHLRLRVKQLISGILNETRIRQSLPQPYIPWTGTQVPWKRKRCKLEFRNCGAIPKRGLLLTVERLIKGM